jgi:hypothetical protein
MTQEKHSAESRIDDGGAAFPVRMGYYLQGMSLRDWFAGMALQSMGIVHNYSKGPCNHAVGERAYLIADAMIAARKSAEQRCEYCGGCGMIAGKEPDDDVMNTPCPRCNPHAEPEWIEWNGGECPVAKGTPGAVKMRDGFISGFGSDLAAWDWTYDTEEDPGDIIAYRIGGKP